MNIYFPITEVINQEADQIIHALNERSHEIKKSIDSQTIFRKISLIALKLLVLASAMVSVASLPVAAAVRTITPLAIAATSLGLAIVCLALCILLDPRSAGESIVKDHWKALFEALRGGNGVEIIRTCKELAKQKETRVNAFSHCLGKLTPNQITPFFHKTCLIGHLLIAIENLRQDQQEQAKSNAYIALSHFEPSGFSNKVERLGKMIVDSPFEMLQQVKNCPIGEGLAALDSLLANVH